MCVGGCCHRSLPCPSLSTPCLQSSISELTKPPCSPWSAGARTMALHMFLVTGHEHSSPAAVGSMGPNKALGGCLNQGHLVSPTPQSGEYLQEQSSHLLQVFSTIRCLVTGWAPSRGLVHTVRALPGLCAHSSQPLLQDSV